MRQDDFEEEVWIFEEEELSTMCMIITKWFETCHGVSKAQEN